MTLGDLLRSVRFVAQRRMRAALTLLGVVIGAGSIVLLASLLAGGEDALLNASQDAVDADLIQVRRDDAPLDQRDKTRRELSRNDAEALGDAQALSGAAVASASEHTTRASLEGRRKRVNMISVPASGRALYKLKVDRGRFIDDDDVAQRRRVCVVGREVWTELLQGRSSIDGAQITMDDQVWSVIGVLEDKPIIGATTGTDIWSRRVLVPETTYDALLSPARDANRVYVRRPRGSGIITPMDTLRGIVDATILRRHLGVRNFKVEKDRSQGQTTLILGVIKILLLGAGFIALAVGGINIMNIMLVTVTERTREIGVRRAVGASPRLIMIQFLVESGAVALFGGVLGVASGALLSFLASLGLRAVLGAWTFHLEPWSLGLGLGLSLLTGVVFGLYPAWRAARLDPVEALRSE